MALVRSLLLCDASCRTNGYHDLIGKQSKIFKKFNGIEVDLKISLKMKTHSTQTSPTQDTIYEFSSFGRGYPYKATFKYFSGEIKTLAPGGPIDAYIVSTEEGFSPLGSNLEFLATELGVPRDDIKHLADWNRFENQGTSLIAIPSRNPKGFLRGLILAAHEGSLCYRQYAAPRYGKPYRDFYYNVTYEALAYAARVWFAKSVAISHLSMCCTFHPDIATCNAEAFLHCVKASFGTIESLTFMRDCDVLLEDLAGVRKLIDSSSEGQLGSHRYIATRQTEYDWYTVIDLKLPMTITAGTAMQKFTRAKA